MRRNNNNNVPCSRAHDEELSSRVTTAHGTQMPAEELGRRQPREQAAEERDHQEEEKNSRLSVLRSQPWDAWSALRRMKKSPEQQGPRLAMRATARYPATPQRHPLTGDNEAVLLHAVHAWHPAGPQSAATHSMRQHQEHQQQQHQREQQPEQHQGPGRAARWEDVPRDWGHVSPTLCVSVSVYVCLHAVHTALHAYSAMQMCVHMCSIVCLCPRERAGHDVEASCLLLCLPQRAGVKTAAVCTRWIPAHFRRACACVVHGC
jgi:hypothetical protein